MSVDFLSLKEQAEMNYTFIGRSRSGMQKICFLKYAEAGAKEAQGNEIDLTSK